MIRAAGALLWRENQDLDVEVALVHRPRYDDWSLPKGKIEVGETALQCAYRELVEETGIRGTFTRQLGSVEYEESNQRKRVIFWAAQCTLGTSTFVANEEVDKILWLTADHALAQATHGSDREIIEHFSREVQRTDTLIILRHTKALERGDWDEADSLRNLSEVGFDQAQMLIKQFEPFADPSVTTATVFLFIVRRRTSDGSSTIAYEMRATPGVYARERSSRVFNGTFEVTSIFPPRCNKNVRSLTFRTVRPL